MARLTTHNLSLLKSIRLVHLDWHRSWSRTVHI